MRILLGVTGSIAAYKACELVSLARKAGDEVRVVMTASAQKLVGPTTFEALSENPVLLDTFTGVTSTMDHIQWAKWAEVVVVAPLSANSLGKLACGLADDALSTVLMAIPRGVRVVLAPAMNTEMWFHPVVQRNLRWLEDLKRYEIVEPVDKRLACGDSGMGGMAAPMDIFQRLAVNVSSTLPARS
jgi:phosphopantothenoylcysteine decarboxylase/phosphopantothenate--cysteine ligase